jgi:hypothetical protein
LHPRAQPLHYYQCFQDSSRGAQQLKRNSFSQISLITFVGVALVASACSNNMGGFSGGSLSSLNSNTGVTDGGSGNFLTISQVIEDTSVSGTFDVIGDGSNAMGADCASSSGTSPAPTPSTSSLPTSTDIQGAGASTCECQFTYNDPTANNATESVEVNTTYHEANMVQCPYGGSIPSGATSVTVSLVSSGTGGVSNSITINLATITNGVNPTDPNSFFQVNRYQCRDSVTVFSLFNQGDTANQIYDPVQSEDPTISYPLNFYTTNYGGSYALYANSGIQNWDCPATPNDPNMPGLDLRVFSNSPDTSGSINIYPPAGSAFDRSTFYVAKQSTGVFNTALDTYVAPTLYGNGGGANPVGYGAAPTSTGVSGHETCPDSSVPIPPGYQWAKLWLFRAGLAERHYLVSEPISSVTVSCNPGEYGPGNSGTDVFPSCDESGSTTGGVTYLNGTSTRAFGSTTLADRVLGGESEVLAGITYPNACVNMSAQHASLNCSSGVNASPGCTTQSSGTAQGGFPFDLYGLGTDVWPLLGTPGAPDNLTLSFYNIPKDSAPQATGTISSDTVNGRSDFLFVVTPASVMSGDMSTGASDVQQYVPYRFPTYSSCPYANPQECTGQISYEYHNQDVAVSGNTTGTTIVFPMCVLQPVAP